MFVNALQAFSLQDKHHLEKSMFMLFDGVVLYLQVFDLERLVDVLYFHSRDFTNQSYHYTSAGQVLLSSLCRKKNHNEPNHLFNAKARRRCEHVRAWPGTAAQAQRIQSLDGRTLREIYAAHGAGNTFQLCFAYPRILHRAFSADRSVYQGIPDCRCGNYGHSDTGNHPYRKLGCDHVPAGTRRIFCSTDTIRREQQLGAG